MTLSWNWECCRILECYLIKWTIFRDTGKRNKMASRPHRISDSDTIPLSLLYFVPIPFHEILSHSRYSKLISGRWKYCRYYHHSSFGQMINFSLAKIYRKCRKKLNWVIVTKIALQIIITFYRLKESLKSTFLYTTHQAWTHTLKQITIR